MTVIRSHQRTAVITAMAVLTAAALAAACATMLKQRRKAKKATLRNSKHRATASADIVVVTATIDNDGVPPEQVPEPDQQVEPVAEQVSSGDGLPVEQQPEAVPPPDATVDAAPDNWATLVPRHAKSAHRNCLRCGRPISTTGRCSSFAVKPSCCLDRVCLGCLADDHHKALASGEQFGCRRCKGEYPQNIFVGIVRQLATMNRPAAWSLFITSWLAARGMCSDAFEELQRLLLATRFDPVQAHQYLHRRMLMAFFDPSMQASADDKERMVSSDTVMALLYKRRDQAWDNIEEALCDVDNPQYAALEVEYETLTTQLLKAHQEAVGIILHQLTPMVTAGASVGFEGIAQVALGGLDQDAAIRMIGQCVLPCLPHIGRITLMCTTDTTSSNVHNEVLTLLPSIYAYIGIACEADPVDQGSLVMVYEGSTFFQLQADEARENEFRKWLQKLWL
eukprot:TRINITY_DN27052_c0_g1_i1.p1 TRINITY_DN27052_c0_g1~~TRINITY_DN27052_c0_g1_i1.p1  ORF type:complete len:451 (-),score=73.70 TRINITY_DN27052_c0_g1_i1:38-1390(-)